MMLLQAHCQHCRPPGKASLSQLASQLTPLPAVCGITWKLNTEWQGQLCRQHQAPWKEQRAEAGHPQLFHSGFVQIVGTNRGDAMYMHPLPHLVTSTIPALLKEVYWHEGTLTTVPACLELLK